MNKLIPWKEIDLPEDVKEKYLDVIDALQAFAHVSGGNAGDNVIKRFCEFCDRLERDPPLYQGATLAEPR